MFQALNRRAVLRGAGGSAAVVLGTRACPTWATPSVKPPLPAFFDDLERRTFDYFWRRANARNGLVPDRWPTPSFCSIAALGFALTAYPLGVERGFVSRTAARDRTLTTLRTLSGLPMGEEPAGVAGHRGFFYHFLDMETGHRYGRCELSTVDTALLHMGVLFAAGWFDGDDAIEAEIRRLAYALVERAEWDWFQQDRTPISMGWHPETGFIRRPWDGYNEGKLVYLLALGSQRHPARDDSWAAWCAPYPRFWRGAGPTRRLAFAPLFGHQYTEAWVDFRGIYDAPMRAVGFDYFENSRRETFANRAYCKRNPLRWTGYGSHLWGLTACDGPGTFPAPGHGSDIAFRGYSARGPVDEPDGFDDGTIGPTAALGSLAFAPEIVIPAGLALQHRAKIDPRLYGEHGFRDSFNPSFRDTNAKLDTGSVDATYGWVATDWLGIDQGPILMAIANYRSDAVWRVMRRSPPILRGLRRAGFTGGWLDAAPA